MKKLQLKRLSLTVTIFSIMSLILVACSRAEPPAAAESMGEQAIHANSASQAYPNPDLPSVAVLYSQKAEDVQVLDTGKVVRLLADDNKGSRHQRFIVQVASGKTVLFAHNIDLAPRVKDIKVGDTIEFCGEYVYNPKGGIVHWTHHDPRGEHYPGWIKLNGKTFD